MNTRSAESPWWDRFRLVAAIAAVTTVVLRIGWRDPVAPHGVLLSIEILAIAAYALSLMIPALLARRPWTSIFRRNPVDAALVLVALTFFWAEGVLTLIAALLAMRQLFRVYFNVIVKSDSPSRVFVGTFASLVLIGTLALKLPVATPPDRPISTVDALFTSTSAVCVTGLVVRDTGSEFTRVGQILILLLIQLGGLGVVVFGAVAALAMGSSMGLRASRTFAETMAEGHARPSTIRRLIMFIAAMTLLTELVGAVFLYIGWPATWSGAPGLAGAADRAFHSVFFAISAFCNAGFATAPNSLEGLRWHWTSHLVIAGLIVVGGLGMPALDNVRAVVAARLSGRRCVEGALVRLTLHTKLVLIVTLTLYVVGAMVIFAGRMAQGHESVMNSALDAHFMSITARTAGFDTVAPGEMGALSRFALMSLMFIGGSPGSTAGGVKTIVFAIIVLTIWATLRGKSTTSAFGRTIPDDLVRKAATLISLGAGIIALLTLALAATDGHRHALGDLLFEVVSACSTVGLTTGVTPELSDSGRLIIVVAMFLGRTGPLVVLAALVSVGAKQRPRIEYPDEPVVMS